MSKSLSLVGLTSLFCLSASLPVLSTPLPADTELGNIAIKKVMRARKIKDLSNVDADYAYCDQIDPSWLNNKNYIYHCAVGRKRRKKIGFYSKHKDGDFSQCQVYSHEFNRQGKKLNSSFVGTCIGILESPIENIVAGNVDRLKT